MNMQRLFLLLCFFVPLVSAHAQTELQKDLARTYIIWQKAMVNKDVRGWESIVSSERKKEVKNKIYSEKFKYPAQIFNTPVPPPSTRDLKMLQAKASGTDAKAVFFGKVNFDVGGEPEQNLLVVSYQKEGGRWRFVKAEYVNLTNLPDIRKQIQNKDYSYLSHADFQPLPYQRKSYIELKSPVSIITKLYAYCPGREVKASYNKRSNHLFQNEQEAEIAIGGSKSGLNEISMSIKSLPGGQKNEPITVRVYLFSQVEGVQPIKAYEYLVKEGGKVDGIVSKTFEITPEMVNKLHGR